MTKRNKLTTKQDWEEYWDGFKLPAEIKKDRNLYSNEILKIFDRFLPKTLNLSILEIGGAPGQYLAYMAKVFHYKINSLEYSEAGCKKTKENFKLLNLSGIVYHKDLFSDISDLPKFDIVYSLGFIEHFSDIRGVVGKHLELLKPGGILLIGAPNFLGINYLVLKRIDPQLLSKHNLSSMDIKNWEKFEKSFNLNLIFKDYIGGFEPDIYHYDNKNIFNRLIYLLFSAIKIMITDRFKFLRNINSKYWSGYVIGVRSSPFFIGKY